MDLAEGEFPLSLFMPHGSFDSSWNQAEILPVILACHLESIRAR
jgi:hypothetical protein